MKGNVVLLAILATGLSAGLFYAWSVSVIPGTKRLPDRNYIEVMQEINRAILNPWFYMIFFGPMVLTILNAYLHFGSNPALVFWISVAAAASYILGTVGVTAFGNVPLNESLDIAKINELSTEELRSTRIVYETTWNRYHTIRMVFSILSFTLLLIATRIETLFHS